MAHFIFENKKTQCGILASLIGIAHKNFSSSLACLLMQKGSNVLVLDMVCKGRWDTDNNAGLYAYLNGMVEAPEIIRSEDADYIYVGNAGRFFVESISQTKFTDLIEQKKRVYDFIIINSCSDSASVESQIYQSLSDLCLVSCDFNSSIQDFHSLFLWNESKNHKSLSFVLMES
jgi:Mrp family chromosome partitioning ATPase